MRARWVVRGRPTWCMTQPIVKTLICAGLAFYALPPFWAARHAWERQPPKKNRASMKFLMGPRGIISLFIFALAARILSRSRIGQLLASPVGRILRLHTPPERNLQAEVETRFSQFLVPDSYVEFPPKRFGLPKREALSKKLEDAANRLKAAGRGRAAAEAAGLSPPPEEQEQEDTHMGHQGQQPHHGLGGPRSKTKAFLEWTSQRKFNLHLNRPRGKLGVVRIKPLPPEVTPLLAIVNSRSGGRQGKGLFKKLKTALCRGQVFDISKVPLSEALRLYANLTNPITILCCGGDGTVSRVIEAVNEMRWGGGQVPRIAVLPLGTGNDLAKSLDWGDHVIDWSGGYFGSSRDASDKAILSMLEDLRRGLWRRLDRWEVCITPGSAVPSLEVLASNKPPLKSMVAYLGIGVDGKVALDFHRLRDKCPWLFFSPTINKAIYGLMGLTDFFVRSCKNLPDKVELFADGKQVFLPPLTESFIILNINSHAGGVQLWPEDEREDGPPSSGWGSHSMHTHTNTNTNGTSTETVSTFRPSRWDDGMLEIVAASGVLHLGKIRVGWARPIRLAQAREIRIRTKSFLPGQIDGEPWKLPRCELTLRPAGQASVLQYLSAELVMFTDWLVRQGQLAPDQREALLKAFKSKAPLSVNSIPRK